MKKKFTKIFSGIMIGAVELSLLTGCSGTLTASENNGQLVKIGSTLASTHPVNIALREVFEPLIEEKTNGKFNIEIYDSSQLGGEKQLYDYTRNGIIEIAAVGTIMWSEVPMMATPDFPFVFRDVAHARRVYQGEVGEYIAQDLESKEPLQFLAWCPNGARVFSSSKPLQSIEDFKGQKLRMPNNPIHIKVAEALGANVVIMDLGEVFTALEQGVVDGQDNPLSTFRQEGWYEVQEYIYETNHMVASIELLGSNQFWDTLTKEEQAIFEEAALETSDKSWDLYEESIAEDKAFMESYGLTVTTPTEEEHEKLVERMEPVYGYLYEEYDWAEDMVKRISEVE